MMSSVLVESSSPFGSSSSSKQDYSSEYLSNELASAEQALAALRGQQRQQSDGDDNDDDNSQQRPLPLSTRLLRLTAESEDLALLQAVTQWTQQHCHDDIDDDDDDDDNLLKQTSACIRLADLLRDRTNVVSSLFQTVYEREYMPLYEYLSTMFVRQVRRSLHAMGYPKKRCTSALWKQLVALSSTTTTTNQQDVVGPLLHAYERLETSHRQTVLHVQGSPPAHQNQLNPMVVELLRPLVTRVHYHFVQTDKDRPTSTRLDRLPEWLFQYLRTEFFQEQGPWEIIYYGWRPAFCPDVLNEVARLAQFVLQQRGVFRSVSSSSSHHPSTTASSPTVLCRAVQEILQFDAFLQNCLTATTTTTTMMSQQPKIWSLTDSFVAGDEELMDWWLGVERETLQRQLRDTGAGDVDTLMAPSAEMFGAMIRSIRTKAALFTSDAYVRQVAGPLCMQFLDAVHDTATSLKDKIITLVRGRGSVDSAGLVQTLHAYMALVNGTHWCAGILTGEMETDENAKTAGTIVPQDDLLRFGQSLQQLERVMVSDLIDNVIGETLLLQKAKLANYLIQTSHILAGHVPPLEDLVPADDLSTDLLDTNQVLTSVLQACTVEHDAPSKYTFAAELIRDAVLEWTCHKFLEALLDESLVTEILAVGGRVIHKDIQLLLGGLVELPPAALRLLDVTHALQKVHLASIGDALCGLAGQPPPLHIHLFACDERLYDEAVSMIRAKGWLWLELPDLLSVLNRRVDLSQAMAL
eukprot:scaffold8130_cov164-Amphora_coffeaeformis.AAC.2